MKKFLIGFCALTILSPLPAAAEELTEARIKAFLEETTRLTHADNGMSDDDITDFLQKHIDDDGRFQSKVLYEVPGHPAQPRDVMMDKEGFIQNVVQGRATMQDYTSSVTLKSANIHGKSAAIMTVTEESGVAPMDAETMVPFTGVSNCQQSLKQKGGDIIIAAASCDTVITFQSE